MATNYQKAASNIYTECRDIIGEAAVGIAKRNSQCELNEDKELVEFKGGNKELKEFIKDYVDIVGAVARRKSEEQIEEINGLNSEDLIQQ